MKLRTLRTTAVLAAAGLALTACGSGDSTDSGTQSGGELTMGMVVDVGTWAATDAAWGNAAPYHQAVYDTLLRTAADGTVEPGLAEEWSYDESGTELTLELRDAVTFSDGEEFNAEVAASNLERFRDGASENAGNLAALEEVEVVDDDTIILHLESPDPALLAYLSQNSGLQASPASFDSPDAQQTPVGSGPYVLDADATIPGSTYALTAREDYWDPEVQHYSSILMNFYPDATALLNALKGGQVDYANLNSTTQLPDAEAAGYTPHLAPVNWKGYILADREGEVNEALGDVRVRQAFNHAFDREALVDAIEGGYAEPTTQIFGPETSAYSADLEDAYPYDPEKAKALLAEAGYPDGITITMPVTSFVPAAELELLAGMLAESNITVDGEQAGSSFIGELLGGKWAAFQFGLNQEPLPWMTYQLAVAPESAWNVQHVEDETIQALAERMRHGGEDGDAAARELNEYLVDEAWFAPIYRVEGALVTADGTTTTHKIGTAAPNLWDIRPTE
ncbi:ABC transporter substrate-binding protein [Zhihengliuella halotolerans]|uniref:ABC transporter substrate-binding protein n=1 Tax=Zhihengliuella halotolerans TaxID=370736 RepID=UPI0015E12F4E|nr:ABC transporter substrate-binding protein [Zhihengliuella halotolerans]